MRTYKLYFSNGKSTLIKANDRQDAWLIAGWMETNENPTIYIQFYHS